MENNRLQLPSIALIMSSAISLIEIPVVMIPCMFLLPFMGDDPTAPFWWRPVVIAGMMLIMAVFGAIPLLVAPVVIHSAWNMLDYRKLDKARLTAKLCMIPGVSPFALVSIPVGIWLYRLLKDPEIIGHFEEVARADAEVQA